MRLKQFRSISKSILHEKFPFHRLRNIPCVEQVYHNFPKYQDTVYDISHKICKLHLSYFHEYIPNYISRWFSSTRFKNKIIFCTKAYYKNMMRLLSVGVLVLI